MTNTTSTARPAQFHVMVGSHEGRYTTLGSFATEDAACRYLDEVGETLLSWTESSWVEDRSTQAQVVARTLCQFPVPADCMALVLAGLVADHVYCDNSVRTAGTGAALWISKF